MDELRKNNLREEEEMSNKVWFLSEKFKEVANDKVRSPHILHVLYLRAIKKNIKATFRDYIQSLSRAMAKLQTKHSISSLPAN